MIGAGAMAAAGASLAVALAISAALTPVVRRWARQCGFVDHPQGQGTHKTHAVATAFGGGIAMTVAILAPMIGVLILAVAAGNGSAAPDGWLARWVPQWPYWLGGVVDKLPVALGIMGGAIVLHIIGLIDDHRPLSPWTKLAVQLLVAVTLTVGFGVRAGEALGAVPAIVLTTLWIVALTNAFNFMDNTDGLSGGVAFLTALVLAISALLAQQVFVPCLLLLVAGALLGFLLYNLPPASIFMGDAGSLVIGYMLAVCTVLTTFYNPDQQRTPFGVLLPLVVFAVPLYDMVSVIVCRLRQGVSIFRPDHRHFSHRLIRRGMRPTAAVLTIYLATAATSLPAMLLPAVGWAGALLILGQCLCVVALIALLESADAPSS